MRMATSIVILLKDARETRAVPRQTLRRGGYLSFIKIRKGLTLLGERFEQRRWFPKLTMLIVKFGNAIVDFLQTHCVRGPHRATAPRRISVPTQINDIDIHRSNRYAF